MKKGEAGIGTLILFIALILVAAIAAGVLIQTSQSLQQKSILVGTASKDQVATGVDVVSIYGEDGSSDSTLEYFMIKVRLKPGSSPIILDQSKVSVFSGNLSQSFSYNGTSDCLLASLDTNGNTFSVEGRSGYDIAGRLLLGDVVDLCFKTSQSIPESTELTFSFSPAKGYTQMTETSVPEIVTAAKIQLFP